MLIFPVGLTKRPNRLPKVVGALTVIIGLVAIAQFVFLSRNDFAPAVKRQWFELLGYDPTKPNWIRALASLLVHTDLWHLIVNLAGLWLFGWFVEMEMGWEMFSVIGLITHLVSLKTQSGFWFWRGDLEPPQLIGSSSIVAFSMGAFLPRFRHIGLKWRIVYGSRLRSREFITPLWSLVVLWLMSQIWLLALHHTEKPVIAHLTGFTIGLTFALTLGWHRIALRDQLRKRAELFERNEEWLKAALTWWQLAHESQDIPANWLSAAHNFLKAGEQEKSERALSKALENLIWDESALDRARQLAFEPSAQNLSLEILFAFAEQLERNQCYLEALELFQRISEAAEFKKAPQALLKVSKLYWRLGNEEKARQAFHRFWSRYSQTLWRQEAIELAAQIRWRGEK